MKHWNPKMYLEIEFDEEKLLKLGNNINDAIIEIDYICWKAGLLNMKEDSINPRYFSVEEGNKGFGKILFVDDILSNFFIAGNFLNSLLILEFNLIIILPTSFINTPILFDIQQYLL